MTTFQDGIVPIYYLAKVIGIFHFSLNNSRRRRTIFECLWSFPFAAIYLGYFVFKANLEFKTDDNHPGAKFREAILTVMSVFKFCIDYIWYITQRGKMKKLLVVIGKLTSQMKLPINKREMKSEIMGIIAIVSATKITLSVLNRTIGNGNNRHVLMPSCTNVILLIGLTTYVMHALMTIMKNLFGSVNKQLKSCGDVDVPTPRAIASVKLYTQIHFQLTEISRNLNSVFSIPILGNALINFVFIIVCTYHIIVDASHWEKFSTAHVYELLTNLFVDVAFACLYILMVYSWDSVAKEANQTGLYLHETWNKLEQRKDIRIDDEENVDLVSLQLINDKLKFTVCRFVNLDWSLLHMVIQAVTMYLVWIIQLKT